MPTSVTFLSAAAVAWSFFDTSSRKAIRASCQDGRLLFDQHWTNVRVLIGDPPYWSDGQETESDVPAIALAKGLSAARQRGSRPQAVTVALYDEAESAETRESQTYAALTSLAGPSVKSVCLEGYLTLTPALAAAFNGTALPGLRSLALNFGEAYDPDEHGHGFDRFVYSFIRLLLAAGPRLQRFKLAHVDSMYALPSVALQALDVCTQLQELELQVGAFSRCPEVASDGDVAAQASILATVGCLTSLRSLDLNDGPTFPPEVAVGHASCLQGLSALTGLTRLRLATMDTWHDRDGAGQSDHYLWWPVWDAQRAALASAVRCMPGLQRLILDGMLLGPQHLAQLTTVTRLEIMGVVPADDADAAAEPASWGLCSIPLPPRLQELKLHSRPSPRQLAALRPPACFQTVEIEQSELTGEGRFGFSFVELAFREWDVSPEGALVAGVPALQRVMAAAARLLNEYVTWPCRKGRRMLSVSHTTRLHEVLLPPGDALGGHACWLRPLAALRLYCLQLVGMALGPRDVAAFAYALPELKRLELWWTTRLPAESLPALGAMRSLEELSVCLVNLEPCSEEDTASALVALFAEAAERGASVASSSSNSSSDGGTGAAKGVAHAQTIAAPLLRVRASTFRAPDWASSVLQAVKETLVLRGLPGQLEIRR